MVQGLGRYRQNLSYRALPAPRATGEGGEIGLHAGFDVADVGFRDLGPDGHGRQLGDPQNQRGLLLGIEGLAGASVQRYHGPGHRRVNAGVAKLSLITAQTGFGLADLCLEHLNAGLGGAQFGAGGLYVLFAGGAASGEVLLALVFLSGQVVLCALLLELGLEVVDGEATGIEPGILRRGVDLHQQLALLDHVTDLDVDFLDLPRGLGAHVDIASRLQGAQRGDAAFDVAPAHGHGRELVPARRDDMPGGHRDGRDQAKCCKQGASGLSGAFHAGFRPVVVGPLLEVATTSGPRPSAARTPADTGSCPVYEPSRGKFKRRHKGLQL
ncbi:hypothetical protein D3C85_628390 [compost metagenome]